MADFGFVERRARLSPEQRRRLDERIKGAANSSWNSIGRRSPSADLPLSYTQDRLWFLDQLGLVGAAYNIPAVVRLEGAVDVTALERSLGEVIRRHEVLRTRFETEDGRGIQ